MASSPVRTIKAPLLSGLFGWTAARMDRGSLVPTALARVVRTYRRLPDAISREQFARLSPTRSAVVTGRLQTFRAALAEANAFVAEYHRHHNPVVGCRFVFGVADDTRVRGYAIAGRPVARQLDPLRVVEVTRLVSDGARNACSKLYGAIYRHVVSLNRQRRACGLPAYEQIITYTLPNEDGASLRAAGFVCTGLTSGGRWHRPGRPRADLHPTGPKRRWVKQVLGSDKTTVAP